MIVRGLSTRKDGSMLVAFDGKFLSENEANRKRFFRKKKIQDVVITKLVHGTDVRFVTHSDTGTILSGFDALVTTESNLFLALTAADCLPIYFWNEDESVVALAHAGWRGVVSGVVPSTLKILESLHFPVDSFHVEVGPGIHVCHFEIQSDVLPRFGAHERHIHHRAGKMFVDLYAIVRDQLLAAGVLGQNITASKDCTACLAEKYFSFRRDKPTPPETMIASIGRRKLE